MENIGLYEQLVESTNRCRNGRQLSSEKENLLGIANAVINKLRENTSTKEAVSKGYTFCCIPENVFDSKWKFIINNKGAIFDCPCSASEDFWTFLLNNVKEAFPAPFTVSVGHVPFTHGNCIALGWNCEQQTTENDFYPDCWECEPDRCVFGKHPLDDDDLVSYCQCGYESQYSNESNSERWERCAYEEANFYERKCDNW
jgi:hypothetical protein